jgi:hypothetical protein
MQKAHGIRRTAGAGGRYKYKLKAISYAYY